MTSEIIHLIFNKTTAGLAAGFFVIPALVAALSIAGFVMNKYFNYVLIAWRWVFADLHGLDIAIGTVSFIAFVALGILLIFRFAA